MTNPAPSGKQNKSPDTLDKLAWLRLSRTENVGPVTFYKLLSVYGTAQNALDALPELAKRGGRKRPLKAPSVSDVQQEYDSLQNLGGEIITAACSSYPIGLSAVDDAPPVISIIGNAALLNQSCIGIVGARNASLNGRKMAENLARDLGKRGHIIASGLARGIDTAAHKGSLETGTIAVVAGGIDVVYPEENQGLYEEIKERGIIVAESKLGQKPFAQSFPRRNRIVSALSKGIVVVESTMRSGSLITARLAGEQGRDVFAVPGSPLDPRAAGPNHLIREGATLICNADDVLESIMNFSGTGLREAIPSSQYYYFEDDAAITNPVELSEKMRETVCEQLSFSPLNVDELVRACHLTVSDVQSVLLEMELAGRLKRLPGNRVSLVSDEEM